MWPIGAAELALEMMVDRLQDRVAFGKPLSEQSVWHERLAEFRCMIDQARLLTLSAANMMDAAGVSGDFSLAEAYAHQRTLRIVDGPDAIHRSAIAKIELAMRSAARASEKKA